MTQEQKERTPAELAEEIIKELNDCIVFVDNGGDSGMGHEELGMEAEAILIKYLMNDRLLREKVEGENKRLKFDLDSAKDTISFMKCHTPEFVAKLKSELEAVNKERDAFQTQAGARKKECFELTIQVNKLREAISYVKLSIINYPEQPVKNMSDEINRALSSPSPKDIGKVVREVDVALEPLSKFMLTGEPREYIEDSVGAKIEWHDTERAREARTKLREIL